jgi:hypothetical protein
LLLDKGINTHVINDYGMSPLAWAVYQHQTETCKYLLRRGLNQINYADGYDYIKNAIDAIRKTMADTSQRAFPAGYKQPREAYLTAEGQPTDALLDACATDQFATLIAAPLMKERNAENNQLFDDIFRALPDYWQNHEAATYLHCKAIMQSRRRPSRGGMELG